MDTVTKMPFTQFALIISVAVLLALYGIYKLITILRKVKRQRKELKKLVTEYEEFLRNRSVNN
ncbi:MAG: hypothetical protein WCL51_09775 [Bacteroidota bacterium]